MKERLKELIMRKLGGKLPDDPCLGISDVCNISVLNGDEFDKKCGVIEVYDQNTLFVGVSYSDHDQCVMLHICCMCHGDWCSMHRPLRNFKFDDGLELLVDLLQNNVIKLIGLSSSYRPEFNAEDKVDHRTAALLATCNKKWLLSINLKHHMLTLPIGKVHPNESILEGLCREMREELGIRLNEIYRPNDIILSARFRKTYDFDGTPVNIETFVFHVNSDERYANGIWGTAENKEPEKCGGLMWVNRDDIRRIAESTGLMLADCVDAALNADMVCVEHVAQ